jgi:hypothetical protein
MELLATWISESPDCNEESMRPELAYAKLVDCIAHMAPAELIALRPSDETQRRVADLVSREKTSGLGRDETSELDHFLEIEHLMRLAKARARQNLTPTQQDFDD